MASMKHPFQGLRWKLTLNFTLVTVATLLVAEMLLVGGISYLVVNSNLIPNLLTIAVEIFIAPHIEAYLDQPEPDIALLTRWLETTYAEGLNFQSPNNPSIRFQLGDFDQSARLIVLDGNLVHLVSVPETDEVLSPAMYRLAEEALIAAQSGEQDPERIFSTPQDDAIIAVPLISETNQILGVLLVKISTSPSGSFANIAFLIGGSLILFTITAGIIGTIFGFLTARGFTRRFSRVSQAADSWSRGDFSTFIQDRSKDELGQLAQRLNLMAEQLQNLLHTNEELAALEERNRLARELHDSVKQQVFATVMQVGAARAHLKQEPETASEHLAEAEKLSRQAQRELSSLIHELRPVSLQDQGLAQALKTYLTDWTRQNNIEASFDQLGEMRLPLATEQALFRVAQETLANVARHSSATVVNVELMYKNEEVRLTITDNGQGFNPASVVGMGFGLSNMAERMTAIGGELEINSAPGQGAHILARCPSGGGSP